MRLTREHLVALCERRDMGIIADAASTHLDARRLLAGLPPEQVAALRVDGRRAVQEIVEANLGVVGLVLSRHANGRTKIRDDLFQEGVIGLISAAWRYDPTQAAFSTYAYHHVKGAVLTSLMTDGGELHLRPAQAKDVVDVRRAEMALMVEGRPANPAAIAMELGRPVKEIRDALGFTRHSGLPLEAVDVVDSSERAQDAFEKVLRIDVSRYVRMLPPLEQQVIDRMYGLNGQTRATQQTIAADLGTSMTGVRRIADTAFAHLRRLIDRPDSQPVPGPARLASRAGLTIQGCHRPEHRGGAIKPPGGQSRPHTSFT